MSRSPALAVLPVAAVLAAVGGLALPADAAPRTARGAYTTGVALPDPTTGGLPAQTCDGLPSSRHRRALALPGPGVLRVEVSSTGDWGLAVRDARGRTLARVDADALAGTERAVVRVRGPVLVDACNFLGAPTAQVRWSWTRGG